MSRRGLVLGGVVPFSTVDFPGRMAAVLFTQGCSLTCRYCHNPHLQSHRRSSVHSWDATLEWLKRRAGLLDGVVISGGEPTIQAGLADALSEIRALGFATGLHTSGANPLLLSQVLHLLDWVALDIKAPFVRYAAVTGKAQSGTQARQSLSALLVSGVNYELRTTLHANLLNDADLLAIATELHARGVGRWVLQKFRVEGCNDVSLCAQPTPYALGGVLPALQKLIPEIVIR